MLSAIAASVISAISGNLIDKVSGMFEQYIKKEITKEQLRAQVDQALLSSFAEVEKSHADALAKTYDSFMRSLAQSKIMQVIWASVVLSQLFVLLWHQVGIPAFVYFTGDRYPSSGTTVEWAYLLLAGCLGMGPVVLRNGPGTMSIDRFKNIIGRS